MWYAVKILYVLGCSATAMQGELNSEHNEQFV